MPYTLSYRSVYFICAIIVVAFGLLMSKHLPVVLPLFNSETRTEALQAMRGIRVRGNWASLATPLKITKDEKGTCIDWEYHYTQRGNTFESEYYTTCSYDQ